MVANILSGKNHFEMPVTYCIRVKGLVDLKWSDWRGGMTITTRKNQGACVTEMVGKVADQAALSGILYAHL